MKGFRGSILVADLSTSDIRTESVKEEIARNFLGGAGYAVRYLYDLVEKDTDPLGPGNPLFFMTGPLMGTTAPSTGRWVVCARSPLTMLWGESNCGGSLGAELKFAGFDGILIKGASQNPVYLYVTEDTQELRDASHLWGLGTYETHRILQEDDTHSKIACIGPAGENLIKYAIISSEERAAGRTGMGAVMGSKRLKAIKVRGKNEHIDLENPEGFKKCAKEARDEVMSVFTSEMFQDLGTSSAVDMYNYRGELPIKYWTQGEFDEADSISGATMKETILVRNRHCFGCPIGCGRIINIKEGPYKTPGEIEGPEYETVAGFGSMILNSSLEAISHANYLCNDLGIDTISASGVIALLYYLYDKKIVTAPDLDGISPVWGDPDPIFKFLHKISFREGIGDTLADGSDAVGRKFGVPPDEIATVDGMEVPYHDLRSCFGMGLAYGVGPRGPCHTACDMYQTALGQPFPELGIVSPDQYDETATMTDACALLQDYRAFYTGVVMCVFCNPSPSSLGDMLTYATGFKIGIPEIKKIGERILNMKRLFNVKMGLTSDWDRLPDILVQPLSEGGASGKSPSWEKMLRQFYDFRKWDPVTGAPTREKREELGLPLL